jgi:glutamine amidotransferase
VIAVVDYGIGNVRSVMNAMAHLGAEAVLTRDPTELASASGLVLPGVGAFGEGMRRLNAHGLKDPLLELAGNGRPLLGICLGFQMLMKSSSEMGNHPGLGLIDAAVVKLPVAARLPNIGWCPVQSASASAPPRLLRGLENELFYFVHTYGVVGAGFVHPTGIARYTDCKFAALMESGNVFGTQFHPEKSGEAGLAMLRNFLDICR